MYTTEKLLQMLISQNASVRYDACEWIRVRHESSPEIVTALEEATHDEDKEVRERAKYALEADVHRQMAIKMGIIKANNIVVHHPLPANEMSVINNVSNTKDEPAKLVLFGFVGIIFAIIGFVLLLNALSTQKLINSSKTWPVIKGEIFVSEIKSIPSSEWASGGYEPIITYLYSVSGVNYTCTMRLGEESTKAQAINILQTYAVGSQINIHYNPVSPQLCVSIYDKVTSGSWIVSVIFIAIGLLLAVSAIRSIVRK